ncbi:TonB-dependent receptor [Maribacter polysiphoniae]|uniref:Iron complex outermembrane receptor protein n=1 Tax=Maribacter polysiphoniae TaxID=429344 RepID=A0A316E2X1_9FLAO|nr:TonB-dependent receptor [Maribacter polysiphoniae]MBD1259185.1 TonB-dependent receptor [Maribacter polysiphoniae]PWK24741.1 iron complex outermembrane receptor protein [Maribacter polysiphoniae]
MKKALTLSFLLLNCIYISFGQEKTITGKVIDEEGIVLPGTDIIIKGTTKGATTNFDGEFTIDAPADAILIFASLGYKTTEIPISGKATINVTLAQAAEQLLETIVIGSRGQPRTKLNTPVPVDVIDIKKEAINMPQQDLSQMLAASAPSFTAYTSGGGDLSSFVSPPSLRGLAPNQMLVLVNGKRRHTSAILSSSQTGTASNAVDMKFIPSIGIDHIEILRDGASAQYGSDAIAGVINIVTKKGTGEFTGTLTVGGYPNKSPDFSDSDLTDGEKALNRSSGDWDGFNFQFDGNYGIEFENGGFFNVSALISQSERTIRPTVLEIDRAPLYSSNYLNNETTDVSGRPVITNPELVAAQASGDAASISSLTTVEGLMAARDIEQVDVATYSGMPAKTLMGFAFNLENPLSETSDFYAFGDFGYQYSDAYSCFYRRAAQADRTSFELYPNGFRPQIYTDQYNLSLSTGITGELGEFDFDLSNSFGMNSAKYGMFNTWNASIGTGSPTEMNLGTHSFLQNTLNLDFTNYYEDILNGLNLAFGGELRVENYAIVAGQEESWTAGSAGVVTATEDNQALVGPDGFPLEDLNANPIVDGTGAAVVLPYAGVSQELVKNYALNCQCFRGFAPENESNSFRSVMAAYMDMELDVTEAFLVSGALRMENYSDFGNVVTGKVAARYSIGDNFAFRGSFSSGFRAPSLQELNYSHSYTFFVGLEPFDGTLYQNNSSAARTLGVGQLQEERSRNFSLGFTTKIGKLNFTLDAYKIDIFDRIFETGEFDAGQAPVLSPIIGSGLASFRINGGDISTKGIEAVLNYNTHIGAGKLGATLSGTFRKNKFEGVNLPDLNTNLSDEELADNYVNRSLIGQFETGTPSGKLIGTVNYSIGKFSAMLRGTRYGSVQTRDSRERTLLDGSTGYADQYFTPEFTTDIGITYNINDKISLTVGGNNIFNEYPEIIRYELRTFNLYSNYQQGSSGAYYFGRISFTL